MNYFLLPLFLLSLLEPMILAKHTWKECEPEILIPYVANPLKEVAGKDSIEIFFNVRQPNLVGVISEMQQNDKWRKKRKGGNALYHEILSFHELDAVNVTPEIFEKIIYEYLSLRCPNAIAYAKVHWDTKKPHCHIVLHGCEYRSSKVLRMDDVEFERIRREIERYSLKFPGLTNSIVYLDKPVRFEQNSIHSDRNVRDQKEFKLKSRTQGQPTKKEIVSATVQDCFNRASSIDHFYDLILQKGFELYQYRNKIAGIKSLDGNRKYRWKTCGITLQKFRDMENHENDIYEMRRAEIEKLSNSSTKKIDKNFGINL